MKNEYFSKRVSPFEVANAKRYHVYLAFLCSIEKLALEDHVEHNHVCRYRSFSDMPDEAPAWKRPKISSSTWTLPVCFFFHGFL